MHKKNIVHRDIRPSTVMMKSDKRGEAGLYLDQFDFAFCLKPSTTVQQTFNVPQRMAPEIEAGKAHDMAADIWSLGQLAYQLLCVPKPTDFLEALPPQDSD